MLPVTAPSSGIRRGGSHRHGGGRWGGRDGWLLGMFAVAAVFLLYRGLNYAGRQQPGVTTVTTQVLSKDSAVVTELVIDKDGKKQSTTVTSGDKGVQVTVVEGAKGVASLRQQMQQQYPGLPKDFDAQVRRWVCSLLFQVPPCRCSLRNALASPSRCLRAACGGPPTHVFHSFCPPTPRCHSCRPTSYTTPTCAAWG